MRYTEPKNLFSSNIYGANFLHWLFHGMDVRDQDKNLLLKNIFNSMLRKINREGIKSLLGRRNSIGYTPIDWLEHYDNQQTLNFIRDSVYL